MTTKVAIEEKEANKAYSGTVNVSLQQNVLAKSEEVMGFQFEMSLKLPWQEIDERARKARSLQEVQEIVNKYVLIDLKRPDGKEVKFDKETQATVSDTIYPPIHKAFGFLVDQRIKGGGKRLKRTFTQTLTDEPEESPGEAIIIGSNSKPRLMTDDPKLATQFNQLQQAVDAALKEMGYKSLDDLMAKAPGKFGDFMKKRNEILARNRGE